MSRIADLAVQQLIAYNASDLEAFVTWYHEDVRVFEGEALVCEGRDAFRERYRRLFTEFEFGGTVDERLNVGGHCVELEVWWRIDPETGTRSEGEILVCYEALDGLIGVVRFLR
jgi:hypothetical protein